MHLSQLFLPTYHKSHKEDAQKEETTLVSHKLMIRAGLMRQVASGIYTWLPLGQMVIDKICSVIDAVMKSYGGQKITMPYVQPATLWKESGRYDAYGPEMLRFNDRHENEMLLGPTHEEIVSDLFRNNVHSYKSFPRLLYQITTKFRDEIRPRFGVMRGREFLMKDAYSFDLTIQNSVDSYYQMYDAYLEIFKQLGLKVLVAKADNGAIGGDMSHEFHILSNHGESVLYLDPKLLSGSTSATGKELYCATDEKHDASVDLGFEPVSSKSIEVGHIFNFGTKYSDAMNITVQNQDQKQVKIQMGSYGIGVSRLVAAAIERNYGTQDCGNDDKGIIWPVGMAPFEVAVINLSPKNEVATQAANNLYASLKVKHSTLLDDTQNSIGEKFATNDLIGTPIQVLIGERHMVDRNVEMKIRSTGESVVIPLDLAAQTITAKLKQLHDLHLNKKKNIADPVIL